MKLIVAYVQTPPPLPPREKSTYILMSSVWNVACLRVPVWVHSIYAVQCRLFVKTYLSGVHCYADDTQVYISFSPNLTLDQLSHGNCLSALDIGYLFVDV